MLRLRADDAPVLLWVHGGPGSTLMPFSEAFDEALLRDYSIVHWDQRGAGRSFDPSREDDPLTLEDIVADGLDLVHRLRQRIGTRRLVLVAHSWGTVVALRMVRSQADLVDQLVLVGTVADYARADTAKLEFIRAHARGDVAESRAIERLGSPPFLTSASAMAVSQRLLKAGAIFGKLTLDALSVAQRRGTVYSSTDWDRQEQAALRSADRLLPALASYRAIEVAPRIDVRVTFVQGALDLAAPTALARPYYEAVAAPRGKRWFELDGLAHFPMWEAPERFAAVLRQALSE